MKSGDTADIFTGNFRVGLGWTPNGDMSGSPFDLDIAAFMLNKDELLLSEKHLVFYNNMISPDGSLKLCGDNEVGGDQGLDNETMIIDLSKIDISVREILFTATIYNSGERKQNFGNISNAFIRLFDEKTSEEIVRFDLDEDFSTETGVIVAKIFREGRAWKFEALGIGDQCGLEYYINVYLDC